MKRMNKGEQPNISGQTLAEFVEKSPPAEGNVAQENKGVRSKAPVKAGKE
jgi:hypothetical protein